MGADSHHAARGSRSRSFFRRPPCFLSHRPPLLSLSPLQVMCGDYGFRSGVGRLYQGGDGEVPASAFTLVRRGGGLEEGGRAHICARRRGKKNLPASTRRPQPSLPLLSLPPFSGRRQLCQGAARPARIHPVWPPPGRPARHAPLHRGRPGGQRPGGQGDGRLPPPGREAGGGGRPARPGQAGGAGRPPPALLPRPGRRPGADRPGLSHPGRRGRVGEGKGAVARAGRAQAAHPGQGFLPGPVLGVGHHVRGPADPGEGR